MEEDLIDTTLNEVPKNVVAEIFRWWERKRLLFNLLMIGIIVFVAAMHLLTNSDTPNYYRFSSDFFVRSIYYFLFINICYCAGWGIQLLAYYAFDIQYNSVKIVNIVLFTIGTVFTGYITLEGYTSYLSISNFL